MSGAAISKCRRGCHVAVIDTEPPTTTGVVALGNLQAQIDGQARRAVVGRLDARGQAELVELLLLRGTSWVASPTTKGRGGAEQLTHNSPTDGVAPWPAGACDIPPLHGRAGGSRRGAAARIGSRRRGPRTSRGLSGGRTLRRGVRHPPRAVERRADFASLAALASLCADRGDAARAEQLFEESRGHYHGVSPFPVAQLDFWRALMWLAQGDLPRARWLGAAHRRLPQYAPAQGHLAEVEAALGDTENAVARLRPLTISSDDPDYTAQLARILSEVGRAAEACEWRPSGCQVRRTPRASSGGLRRPRREFWLEAGADPHRALSLATRNLEVRPTPRP